MAINKNTHKNKGYQMKKSTLGILGTIAMTAALYADVPYTFTPYTPAKASEVNANFKALSDQLIVLENNVSNVSSNSGSSCSEKSPFSYIYTYTPSAIGETVTVRGVEYIMLAMPFIEFGTGDHYYVKYPSIKSNDTDKNINLYTSIYTRYEVENGCYIYNFAGFPSKYYSDINYYTNYSARIDEPAATDDKYVIEHNVDFFTDIKINQTTLNIRMSIDKKTQVTPIVSGDVDMTDNIDWDAANIVPDLVNDVKTLTNYVEIVKIP